MPLQLPDPESGYAWARLEGGPLDGEVILAPVEAQRRNLPARFIGVLAPVLDEEAETFAWEPVTYLWPARSQSHPRPGEVWVYVAARRTSAMTSTSPRQ